MMGSVIEGGDKNGIVINHICYQTYIPYPTSTVSPYRHMRSPARFNDMKYFATLDDPFIHMLAAQIMHFDTIPLTRRGLLKYLHRIFRDNFEYITDKDHFGVDDFWEFPVDFFLYGGGDCDGFSLAFVSLARTFGFDSRPVIISKLNSDMTYHMIVATTINGKTIYSDPTTGQFNVEIDPSIIYYSVEPEMPTKEFLSNLERYEVKA